ncbi:replication initiation protein [Mycobacterium phage Mendokysei]|uniref:Helix-turn-helix DNA binding domain protein n=1 Tax=Mycobacterium phage Mendokysei TaxID=2099637 RepID=A0A2P1CG94_9CAUD|nr:replication initiation protein [Mycobacterium phage Mendokysei]AVJ50262.1 hypothetical protein SEA_MENDOKYSEI_46 [Mycobacterium phage Mendokysei]
MPRIRTIKPEFFRSPDTARVDFPVRIFYQALWCWADDFGVGETNIYGLLGFAFCDEDGFTAQDLRRFCADVAQHYGVIFYEVRGRHYYAIPSWREHQKTESREDRRKYPPPDHPEAVPDLRFQPCADSAPDDRRETGAESRGTVAGTGEQGNRGTGNPPNPPAHEPPAPAPRTAQRKTGTEIVRSRYADLNRQSRSAEAVDIVDAFAAHLGTAFVPSVRDGIAEQVQTCVRAGIPREQIARGLLAWQTSDSFSPKQIGTFVAKAAQSKPTGVGKPTQKAMGWDEVGAAVIAQVTSQNGDAS